MEVLSQARALLGGEEEDHLQDAHGATENTKPLRIAAVFVILCAGLLGGIPPLFVKAFRDQTSTQSIVVRAFSAGVILALALVHIIPEAILEMNGLGSSAGLDAHAHDDHGEEELHAASRRLLGTGHESYPYGGICVLFGLALMVLLEHVAHIFFGNSHSHGHGAHAGAHGHSDHEHAAVPDVEALKAEASREATAHVGHAHDCVSRGSASNWVAASTNTSCAASFRLQLLAVLFEFGCIFHSFIIGLTLGVNKTDLTEVRALLIALAFHQWLEGISLASVVSTAQFAMWKRSLMIVAYSLTCPVGVAIGIGIAETYDGESERARGLQGAFNGVSGGMLLYISLVQLVAEDMSKAFAGESGRRVRVLSYISLLLGAGLMCMLAVWA